MNYAVEQRLRMIDFLLASYAYAAPRHLVDFFGISKPQASLDFAQYNKLHPGNTTYLHANLAWYATTTFQRVYP